MSRSLTTVVVALVMAGAVRPAIAQTGERFRARLTPLPRDAANMRDLTGIGSATATLSGNKLTINGTFEGLRGPATVARLHRAQTGVRGDSVFDLTVSRAPSGTVTASLDLSPLLVDDLRKGRLYIQIHSEKAPDGNLWGWLLR